MVGKNGGGGVNVRINKEAQAKTASQYSQLSATIGIFSLPIQLTTEIKFLTQVCPHVFIIPKARHYSNYLHCVS